MITWSEKQAAEYERADQMSPHHPSHHRAYHPPPQSWPSKFMST